MNDATAPVREAQLSVNGAIAEIRQLEGRRSTLEARTAGIEWIVWGLAMTAMFLTYDFFGVLSDHDPSVADAFPYLWIPWIGIGLLATHFLWRSVALESHRHGNRRRFQITAALTLLTSAIGGVLIAWFDVYVPAPGIILGIIGLAYVLQGVVGFACVDRFERGLRIVVGALFVLAVAWVTILAGGGRSALIVLGVVAPLSTLLALTGAGAFLSWRS